MATKTFIDFFRGSEVLAIRHVDSDGEYNPDERPVVAFGKKKAKAILNHIDEIRDFVEKEEQKEKKNG